VTPGSSVETWRKRNLGPGKVGVVTGPELNRSLAISKIASGVPQEDPGFQISPREDDYRARCYEEVDPD